MSGGRSSMREGPLSELFRNTVEGPPQTPQDREPPPWGRDAPAFPQERSNYLAVIKCVGIGGGGVNAVNRMIEAGIRGVEFIAINTDRQSLDASEADVRIPVGLELTRGRGTGGNASLGEQAMRESEEHIRRALRGADLVFIATGEGGGTGTGGAPVVAKLAREMGALTIAVVTRPFAFEGSRRQGMADTGVNALRDQADTIIVIQNDRLLSVLDRGVSMVDAFRVCDDLLRQGVQGITDMITLPGLINLDFADVRTVIRGAGTALLGIGYASGANRAEDAALAAISSPLLETPIDGARGILLGVTGGPDLSLAEINRAARVVADASDPEANIIFGATVDPELEGKVWVTVVAAGFSGRRAVAARPPEPPKPATFAQPAPPAAPPRPAPASPFASTVAAGGDDAPAEPPEAPDLSAAGSDEAARTRLFESPYPSAPRADEPGEAG
jgi:cell division protein FtsZ